jgi:hypothetical protein
VSVGGGTTVPESGGGGLVLPGGGSDPGGGGGTLARDVPSPQPPRPMVTANASDKAGQIDLSLGDGVGFMPVLSNCVTKRISERCSETGLRQRHDVALPILHLALRLGGCQAWRKGTLGFLTGRRLNHYFLIPNSSHSLLSASAISGETAISR